MANFRPSKGDPEKRTGRFNVLSRLGQRAAREDIRESKAGARASRAEEEANRTEKILGMRKLGLAREEKDSDKEQGAKFHPVLASAVTLIGLIYYLLKVLYFGPDSTNGYLFAISFVLMVLAAFAISGFKFENVLAVFFPILIFFIWYSFGDNWSYVFLVTYLILCGALVFVLALIFGAAKLKLELIGFLPVLLFFADIGLISWFLTAYNWQIQTWLANTILYTPWWFFFGVFALPSGEDHSFYDFLKVVVLLWILFSYMTPFIPEIGHETLDLPSLEDITESQEKLLEMTPKTELVIVSRMLCLGDFQDYEGCIERRQEESLVKAICNEKDIVKSGLQTESECFEEEMERLQRREEGVSGQEDRSITEKTKATLTVDDYFPRKTYRKEGDTVPLSYPLNFEMNNPRFEDNNRIGVEFSCHFKSSDGEIIEGISNPESVEIDRREFSTTVLCESQEEFEGTVTLVQQALIKNMNTWTKLPKIIVGQKDNAWMEEWTQRIISAHCQGGCVSLAPAEFATLNFAFGRSLRDPILRAGDTYFFAATVEKGPMPGEIVRINEYEIDLGPLNSYVNPPSALRGTNIEADDGEMVYLVRATLDDLPEEYKDLGDDYLYREFIGKINYDFLLEKEERGLEVEGVS